MSTQTQLVLDTKRALAILNSRKRLGRANVGQQVMLAIQGNGTYQTADQQRQSDAEKGRPAAKEYFDKYIYNTKAFSLDAVMDIENKKLFAAAVKAESAGNVEEATKLFNQYLNNVQVSFNLIDNSTRAKLNDGDAITAYVELVKNRDDKEVVALRDVKYKAPTQLDSVKFDITDLIMDDAAPEAIAPASTVTP